MIADDSLLFVYGTLRWRRSHPMAAWVWRRSRPVAPASVQGRLYNCDGFPGLVLSDDPEDRVDGMVLSLDRAARRFLTLDNYEGFDASVPEKCLFFRTRIMTRLVSGRECAAWTYRYALPIDRRRRIASWG